MFRGMMRLHFVIGQVKDFQPQLNGNMLVNREKGRLFQFGNKWMPNGKYFANSWTLGEMHFQHQTMVQMVTK